MLWGYYITEYDNRFMRAIILVLILCSFKINSFSQLSNVNHWVTLIQSDTILKYQTNTNSIIDDDWRNNDYEDSNWLEGRGGVGYGDDDDNTVVDFVSSVFLRAQFNVIDKSEIAAAILTIDYDDAFVAFLNGVEIARSGGLSDPFPAFDALSSQQHETVLQTGGTPSNIVIENDILITNLNVGANTLALQVHNASNTSSDLSSNFWFLVGLNVATERYSPPPTWFKEPLTDFSSSLPIFVIDTENGLSIRDEPKRNAHLGIIFNGAGIKNRTDDAYTEYDGYIGIELRGNSTSGFPKKPYNFETRDSLGENLNISLLGMPKENDWVLRASYLDHTFIRNGLANYMARETGYWASRTKHVEVILNGDYQGIYLLMEDIKRDKNRVDIARLDSNEIAGVDMTGGYIWEITGFDEHFGERRKLKYPHIDDVNPIQLQYIQDVDDAFRNKMRESENIYSNPNDGYVNHIWTESFISEAIIQEAMRNGDAYGWSGYYHKDKNGLINAGPVWDFDQSSGNSSYPDNGVVDGWMIEHPNTTSTPFYWPLLLNEPYFRYSLSLRWKELRMNKFSDISLFAHIDSIASLITDAQAREFKKWPVLGKSIWRETTGYKQRDTYQKEVDYMKNFFSERWNWIDLQLENIQEPSGYPSISNTDISDMTEPLSKKKVYLNLNDIFSYPYNPKLKYSAFSTDTNIVFTDVKKSDSLKLELNNLGTCGISITATDTYGNKKNTAFNIEVVSLQNGENNTNSDFGRQFTLYPNPTSNYINIQQLRSTSSNVSIELYNNLGQKIDNIYSGTYVKTIKYDCTNLDNGIYFVRIKTDSNKCYTLKLIVQK